MKEVGTTSWNSPNTVTSNTSLFTGLQGGDRYDYGGFSAIGDFGNWWSSTQDNAVLTWNRYLHYYNGYANRD